MGSNHIRRNQAQSSIVVWWRPLKIQGAFEFCAPMDDVLKVTGQPAEDFEVTARRYATLPKAQRTLANGCAPGSISCARRSAHPEMGFKGIRLANYTVTILEGFDPLVGFRRSRLRFRSELG